MIFSDCLNDIAGPRNAPSPSFEGLLPAIEQQARRAFRKARPAHREELVADVIARAFALFRRLLERGLDGLIYVSALARFAIRQVLDGRRLGSRQSVRDVLSIAAQRKQGFRVAPLQEDKDYAWDEILADPRANPADVAICRIDFGTWLARLSHLKRHVAERLSAGDTTNEAAQYFRVSPGRISQLRRELRDDWTVFQGQTAAL
jgi:hypothetical protein